eukprot:1195954-Prorocentrum_minimum.AAC.2
MMRTDGVWRHGLGDGELQDEGPEAVDGPWAAADDDDVVYGDTDSVMVNFKTKDLKRSMDLGLEAAEMITKTFERPIQLEFEKCYYPFLLISKKRYAALMWTNPDKYDKMDTKGIETVRRDNCLLVKNVVTTSLNKLLIERDVPGALAYIKQIISDLLMNRIDLSLLVVTKGLTQQADRQRPPHEPVPQG